MAGKVSQVKSKKAREADESRPTKPKRLSKAGKWLETHPGGAFEILDMRAVMK